jgi:hypothetical protein
MVTGEKSDTWGDITNTNLGTLLEQAVSGYVTQAVATGTDTTITIPDGSTGVARNMYIELTGTGGAATNLIVPAKKKLYFIYNNTASGQVTVKVSGQTGVSVANGTKVILVCDGTDVELATSYPTLPVAVADGGTGQTSYTNGQLLIGNSTGNTLTKATLTAGSNITITNGAGSITIASTSALAGTTTSSLTALGTNAGDSVTSGAGNTVVGYQAGTDLTTGGLNTFVGEYAGWKQVSGTINTAIGRFSGAYGTSYTGCTYMGHGAGIYRTGDANTGIGYQALAGNGSVASTGYSNTAVGYSALESATTGFGNVAVGNGSSYSLTTGYRNVTIGFGAGNNLTTTIGATAIGYQALYDFTVATGNELSFNTALGYEAGANLAVSNGSYACTFIGGLSGTSVTSGTYVTALGFEALASSSNYSNIVGVGSSTSVTGSNQVQLGDASTTTYAYGSVQNRSDERDKTEIKDTGLGLDFIMALRPRDFKWDMREDYRTSAPTKPQRDDYESDEAYQAALAAWNVDFAAWQEASKLANITHDGTHTRTRYHHGLIAQEVKQTMDAMGVDFGGYQDHSLKGGDAVLSIGYEELVAPLIKAIQELKAEFDEYKRTHP